MPSKYRCTYKQVMSWNPCLSASRVRFLFGKKRFYNTGQILEHRGLCELYMLWLLARSQMLPRRVVNKLKKMFGSQTKSWDDAKRWKDGDTPLFTYIFWYTLYCAEEIVDYIRELYKETPW